MSELRSKVFVLVPVLSLLAGSASAAERSAPDSHHAPRRAGGEAVDVEIKIVPFYAIDGQGSPVFDLRQDEIELRIGGKAVPIDTLDRYPMTARPSASPEAAGTTAAPPPRHVLFLLDSAFATAAGFRDARKAAERLLDDVPASDRVELRTHTARSGITTRLAPMQADAKGKARLREEIEKLLPEIGQVSTDFGSDLPPPVLGMGGGRTAAPPASNFDEEADSMQGAARGQYDAIARGLAGALEETARELKRESGPKLVLLFWQGLDSDLFFKGDVGMKPGSGNFGSTLGSSDSTQSDGRRTSPLMNHFVRPLQTLADSGAMTVFVNAAAPSLSGTDEEGALRQIAQSAGGLYVGGADPGAVEQRVAAATSAYYEAGFYLRGEPRTVRETVDVVVRRPGVRAWAPAAVKVREAWDGLSAAEKKVLILDLVAGGPEVQQARSKVRLDLADLAGQVLSRPDSKDRAGKRLRYDAAWPADLSGKDVEIYNVTLRAPGPGEKSPTVLLFEDHDGVRAGSEPLEIALGAKDALIWGIVAIEPTTQRAWYRRLRLQG